VSIKEKVLIIALVIFGFFVIAGAIGSTTIRKANPNDITGITQFVVLNDNGVHKARFSLNDQNNALVSSDANVRFNMSQANNDTLIYHSNENIKAYQFNDVTLILTGAKMLAYSWQILPEQLHGLNPDKAEVLVTLPNGKQLSAATEIHTLK
jgi:predicted 3-demethylubiquinone-9 3-methyltransferase (glyoxalase superfamily)